MKNSILDQVMGRRPCNEDVPVPLAALPRRSYRDRLERQRQRRDPDGLEKENESMDRSALRAVLGEAAEEEGDNLIPDSAEDIDAGEHVITARLNPIKDVVQEPSYPSGEKEKYLTPYAALTAPDATPEGMSPIDPSKVPGVTPASKFTWSELEKVTPEPSAEAPASPTGGDTAVNTMDVLLGRERTGAPAKDLAGMEATGVIATEEAALAALGIQNPAIVEAAAAKAAAALMPNVDPTGESMMPEHKTADPKKVYEAARKWM